MNNYVRTETYLDKILAHKVDEVAQARKQHPLARLLRWHKSSRPLCQ